MTVFGPGRESSYLVCLFPFKLFEGVKGVFNKQCSEEETCLPIGASSKPLTEEESEKLHNLPGGWYHNFITNVREILWRQTEYGLAQFWHQKRTTSI